MANNYVKNQTVRITGTFTVSGVNTDPTTVTLKIQTPAGVESTYTYALAQVTKSATGIYYKDVSLNEVGMWYYRWEGTGTVAAADETYLNVLQSEF